MEFHHVVKHHGILQFRQIHQMSLRSFNVFRVVKLHQSPLERHRHYEELH
jgi:hypothetical protein